jgi:outer membrane protein TolC
MSRYPLLLLLLSSLAAAETAGLDLATTLRQVQERNPEITIARQRVAEAQAQLAQTAAAWQPRLSLDAGYSYMDQPLAAFAAILNQEAFTPSIDFNDTPEADDLSLSLNAGYRLYDGGQRRAQRSAAQAGLEANRAGEQATREHLALAATQAWLQAYQAGRHAAAATAMRDALTSHLQTARNHQQQGTLLEADVLEVQLRLQEAEEQVLRIGNQRQLAAAALGSLLGSTGQVSIAAELPQLSVPDETAAQRRPELLAAQAMMQAADQGIAAERAGWRPTVDAFGSVAYHDGFVLDEAEGRVSWVAGVNLHLTLWDGHLTSQRVEAARSRLLVAEGQLRRAELQIALQQTEARLSLDNARQRLAVVGQALQLADKHVELTAARFGEGLTTVTQMVDAETARSAARIRLSNAEADVLLATASLRHALGLNILEP